MIYVGFPPAAQNFLVSKGGHYGLTGRPIKNLKMPKKVRQGGQNLGKITRKLELETFFASNGKLFFSK